MYDLTLTLAWEGFHAASETTVKGELKLSEFASANDDDEFVLVATCDSKGREAEALRQRAAALRPALVRELLAIAAAMLEQ